MSSPYVMDEYEKDRLNSVYNYYGLNNNQRDYSLLNKSYENEPNLLYKPNKNFNQITKPLFTNEENLGNYFEQNFPNERNNMNITGKLFIGSNEDYNKQQKQEQQEQQKQIFNKGVSWTSIVFTSLIITTICLLLFEKKMWSKSLNLRIKNSKILDYVLFAMIGIAGFILFFNIISLFIGANGSISSLISVLYLLFNISVIIFSIEAFQYKNSSTDTIILTGAFAVYGVIMLILYLYNTLLIHNIV